MAGHQGDLAGDALKLTLQPPQEGAQPRRFPEIAAAAPASQGDQSVIVPRPQDILTIEQAVLIRKADAGQLPCPRCANPLAARVLPYEDANEVLLWCPCGFEEL